MTEVISNAPESDVSVESHSAPEETFRGRLRRGVQEAYSVLDLSAGVALAGIDAHTHAETMNSLNERYNGLLERRTANDRISMALQSDIELDFRRDAQRAGFTELASMSTDRRHEIAEEAAASYLDDIIAELQGHHPDWSTEETETLAHQYAHDIATILAMDTEQRDTYQAAMFEYQETSKALSEAQAEQQDLQTERNARLRNFGRIAMQTLVAVAKEVSMLPYELGARASVMLLQVREWYGNRTPEGKKKVWFSAAGVAVAGLVAYVATRHTGHTGTGNYTLASYDVPVPDKVAHPAGLGGSHPGLGGVAHSTGLGGNVAAHPAGLGGANALHPNGLGGNQHPTGLGGNAVHPGGLGGSAHPNGLGGVKHPGGLGVNHPNGLDGNPNVVTTPNIVTSHDLFTGSGSINKWPDTITVSHWNAKTHDGSVWGISEQILRRSGINNPSNQQIKQLVDALRPQAQPNGYLLDGQTLHLKPALDALQQLS